MKKGKEEERDEGKTERSE